MFVVVNIARFNIKYSILRGKNCAKVIKHWPEPKQIVFFVLFCSVFFFFFSGNRSPSTPWNIAGNVWQRQDKECCPLHWFTRRWTDRGERNCFSLSPTIDLQLLWSPDRQVFFFDFLSSVAFSVVWLFKRNHLTQKTQIDWLAPYCNNCSKDAKGYFPILWSFSR